MRRNDLDPILRGLGGYFKAVEPEAAAVAGIPQPEAVREADALAGV